MSNSFGAAGDQERGRRSGTVRDTSQLGLASSADHFQAAASHQRGRGVAEPAGGSGGTTRRRTGALVGSASDCSQTILARPPSESGKSGADEIAERAASCRPASTTSSVQAGAGTHRRPASGGARVSVGGTTSNSQRLSSIEILNENKQRQLQLEQQESFKQHLEERQRFIQQQGRDGAGDLAYSAYQVEPSAADYARMAAAANAARQRATATAGAPGARRQIGGASTAPVNPFDEEPPYPSARDEPAADQAEPSTVSGRSGFLATLMGDTTEPTSGAPASTSKQQICDESGEELDSSSGDVGRTRLHDSTRYSKVAQSGSRSYDYDGTQRDQRPFYSKDLATLLAECRGSRKLVILIVAVALLLDNMLLTAVVPIIPAYLYKLRVYHEHRDQLSAVRASENSSFVERLDTNRDGKVDAQELQDELARRMNESYARMRDRLSGSFLHPRLLKPRDPFGSNVDEDGDKDDDTNDLWAGRGGADSDAERGNREGDQDERPSNRRPTVRKNRYRRAQMSADVPSPKSDMADEYEANDDDDNDDDDDDDDGHDKNGADGNRKPDDRSRREDKMNGKIDREKELATARSNGQKQASKSGSDARRAASVKSDYNGASENKLKSESVTSDEDDDDEDAEAARNWNKLKSSLEAMVRTATNDSELLGGMCLSYVRNRSNSLREQADDEADGDSPSDDRPKSAATSRERNDSAGSEDDDQQKSADRGKQSSPYSRGRARDRWPGRDRNEQAARVDRLKPRRPAARKTSKSLDEKADTSKGDTGVTKIGDDDVIINHQDIVDESFEVGVMFASKPIVQAIANPFVGAITNRVGFTLPMFLGFTIMFLSTLVFAFGETYATLFLARAIQGVGSACTSVAGMSMIADRFPDDAERGNAMAVALGGLALGVVLGPPFGGFMYEFFGKPSPFIVLAILALLDGLLQLLVLQPRVTKCQDEGASLMTLIKDPYILVAAGAITFANTGIGILEPALPLWMLDTMQAKNWEQGVAFLPAALSYLFSTNLFGNLGLRIGRWRSAMLGLVIIGCSLLLIPFASRVDHLILPNGAIGFAIGMVDSTMMPMLGYLVDIRHTSVYGSVYAIGDVAFCAGFVFGPALSGTLVELIGFEGLIITTALICFAFAPLLVLLRDPPPRQLNEAQMQEQSTLRYVNYSHLDAPDKEAKSMSKNYSG